MPIDLIANGGANEVRSICVEAVLHHQVDVAEVDVAEIYGDLFTVDGLWPQLMHIGSNHVAIHIPSVWMLYRTRSSAFKTRFSGRKNPSGDLWLCSGRFSQTMHESSVAT